MSYKFRPVVGLPKQGMGYPTVDQDGNVTLPGEIKSYPPEKWHSLTIDSDAAQKDASDMGVSSTATSDPVGAVRPPMRERFEGKRGR